MPTPYETLRRAYEDERRVTVTENDGTTHENNVVRDFTRVQTRDFEVWEFVLGDAYGTTTLFGPDLETVEVLD